MKARNKQVSDRLHVFEGFILPLNPLRLQFVFGLYFTPSLQSLFCILHPACVLLSVCSLHFTLRLHFTPGLQTAVPRGGGDPPYMGHMGMCCCEGYGFQAVYSRIGYHFSGN